MDKLKRVLSGNDDSPNDENRGIMGDVRWKLEFFFCEPQTKKKKQIYLSIIDFMIIFDGSDKFDYKKKRFKLKMKSNGN